MSYITKIKNSRSDLLYLITGSENKIPTWYYFMADKTKHEIFKVRIKSTKVILNDYGTILFCGWGKEPPKDIKQKINEEFC